MLLALRNWRQGRADRRSAWRLAVFVFVAMLIMWLCGYHHVLMLEEVEAVEHGVAKSLLLAAGTWLLYVAVEPFVRRFWPRTLISWTRLMRGRLRDPLIGQDVLLGVLAGCAAELAITYAPSRWYSNVGIVQFALLAGLALYGFYTSLGGWPVLREAFLEGS